MRQIIVLITLLFATSAYADNLTPANSTLFIERGTSPDRLMQEVDPNYAFHAKAAKKRLKRSLYFLLKSLNEYKLYQNHLRTLSLEADDKNKATILATIKLLDKELHPRVKHSPLAHVMSTVPEVSMSVDPTNRSLHVGEPVRFSASESMLYDGLASPRERSGGGSSIVRESYSGQVTPVSSSPATRTLSDFAIPTMGSPVKEQAAKDCATCPPPPSYTLAK